MNGGKFGCYAPPFTEKLWLERFAFMEKAGARWWPIAGGLYVAGGTVTLTKGTVESNFVNGGYGGGLFIAKGATVYLDSFTVANTINNTDSSGLNGPTANIDGTYILR